MTHKKNRRLRFGFVLMMLCTFSFAHAQSDPGGDPDAGIPIDGGVSLVIAAAIGYAAKKGMDKRRKEQKGENSIEQSGDVE